jgi:hypothetical protein
MDQPEEFPALDADDLNALEARLAGWRPSAGALESNRDRLIYQAGYAAGRAENRINVWRLATAAFLLISAGLSALVVRERVLRTREHTHRSSLEMADRKSVPVLAPAVTSARDDDRQPTKAEPFAPGSYFALTARMAQGDGDLFSPDAEIKPQSPRLAPNPADKPTFPGPLRVRDVERVLDL